MEFTIINRSGSLFNELNEPRLTLASYALCDKLHLNYNSIFFLEAYIIKEHFSLERRIKFYSKVLPTLSKDYTTEEILGMLDEFRKFSRRKRRSKDCLLLYLEYKKLLEYFDKIFAEYCEIILKKINLREFDGLLKKDEKKNIFIHYYKNFDSDNPEVSEYIEEYAQTFYRDFEINILDVSVKENVHSERINDCDPLIFFQLQGPKYFDIPFVVIPELYSMDANSLFNMKKDLLKGLEPFWDKFKEINKKISSMEFNSGSYDYISGELSNEIKYLGEYLQNIIDNNYYISEQRKNTKEIWEINIGLTSFDNLIDIYEKLKILDEQICLYTRENVLSFVNIKGMKTFLFVN